ncbi:hypothetical protein D3C71_1056830 [compost metagenome]
MQLTGLYVKQRKVLFAVCPQDRTDGGQARGQPTEGIRPDGSFFFEQHKSRRPHVTPLQGGQKIPRRNCDIRDALARLVAECSRLPAHEKAIGQHRQSLPAQRQAGGGDNIPPTARPAPRSQQQGPRRIASAQAFDAHPLAGLQQVRDAASHRIRCVSRDTPSGVQDRYAVDVKSVLALCECKALGLAWPAGDGLGDFFFGVG